MTGPRENPSINNAFNILTEEIRLRDAAHKGTQKRLDMAQRNFEVAAASEERERTRFHWKEFVMGLLVGGVQVAIIAAFKIHSGH